jgi:tripartite-type tricarboxylate transporter receptor subunit TctC
MINSHARRSLLRVASAALCVSAAVFATAAAAEEWAPTKTVRIVVPMIGSTNDALARLIAPGLQKALGQAVIVENKGGAGGSIGANDVAKSPPDGHTLLIGYNGPIAINQTLYGKLPYDPVKDLAPITLAVSSPQFLVVGRDVPAKSVAELVALTKTKSMAYASTSLGSASHLTMEMFKSAAKIDITHVPYKGAGPAVTDLVAGQVDAAFMVPGNIQQFAKEGRLRLLASTGDKRFASTPNVPTMIEAGYPGFLALSWIGVLAPGGTPQPIIDRYHKELVRILREPEVRRRLEDMEFKVIASTPKEFADWIAAEIPRWGKVIKETGAKPE